MECDRCKREAVFQVEIEQTGRRNLCRECYSKQIVEADAPTTARRLVDLPPSQRKSSGADAVPIDIYRIIWWQDLQFHII